MIMSPEGATLTRIQMLAKPCR